MSNSVLLDKSKVFALEVIQLCNEVRTNKKESILTNQLVRSGTSVGANIREAFYAHGKADFIAKLHIALKECTESEYWLELLLDGGYTENLFVLEQCYRSEENSDRIYKHGNCNFLWMQTSG